jgi:hypothetical protein
LELSEAGRNFYVILQQVEKPSAIFHIIAENGMLYLGPAGKTGRKFSQARR